MSYQLQTPKRQTARSMVGSVARGTPSKAEASPLIVTDSPGNWRHPRMEEITRRRATSVFTEANLKTLVYNGLAMFVCFLVGYSTGTPFKQLRRLAYTVVPPQYGGLVALAINAVLAINMVRAVLPLFRQTDALVDIPLTPSQRKLLGLEPLRTGAPAPNAGYTTPPRYARTPSVSGSAASLATATRRGSLSGNGSGNDNTFNNRSFSTGSPIANSPLFPKARTGSGSGSGSGNGSPFAFSPGNSVFQSGRRSSFGSPGAVGGGGSLFGDASSLSSAVPGTPSPTSGKRLSMGLNNKWLYEKGRRTSSGTRIY